MTRHSSIVGGSTAGRLLECPGSYQAVLALPPSADVSSEYAMEGTAMHAVMDRLMRNRMVGATTQAQPEHWLDFEFIDRKLTQDHIDTMIQPALAALHELELAYSPSPDTLGSAFWVAGVEERVAFPGIPGAFGTSDLILASETHVLHVDWKFGQGVAVPAIYHEGDSLAEKLNPQMMFYTAASMSSLKSIYVPKKKVVIAIIQPRTTPALTHTEVTRKEIKYFTEDLHNAVISALDRNPPRARGEHCRFAPCKVDCPLWTGPLLDLAALSGDLGRTEMVSKSPSAYADYIAKAKELADLAAQWKQEIDEQLHAYLADGGEVPGWKLKAKVKLRQWVDEVTVDNTLAGLGFDEDEIWDTKLATFAKAEKAAKRLGVKIPDHLRVAPPTNETTIARSDDPAPAVNPKLAIEQFRASIPLLSGRG
jgi:hypothetical protein